MHKQFMGYRNENRLVSTYSLVLGAGGALIVTLALTSAMLIAVDQYRAGAISKGQFVALFTLLNQVFMPVSGIGRAYRDIKAALIRWEALKAMLDKPLEAGFRLKLTSTKAPETAQALTLTCRQLSFSYGDKIIVQNLDFQLTAGKITALVGPSGAGKSSLVKLLLGLNQPDQGQISLNAINSRDFDLQDWRSHFGVVTQDPSLLNDSLRANILFGRQFESKAAEETALNRAIEIARVSLFLDQLPKGLDTLIKTSAQLLGFPHWGKFAINPPDKMGWFYGFIFR